MDGSYYWCWNSFLLRGSWRNERYYLHTGCPVLRYGLRIHNPCLFISLIITGNAIPQLGLVGDYVKDGVGQSVPLIEKINQISIDLGFTKYTENTSNTLDLFCITAALMVGTAGLPHVIVRFFTVKNVKAVRKSAYWTLSFIAIIYLTAPALGMFARTNFIEEINGKKYQEAPEWFKNWENQGMIAWVDKNEDGIMQYRAGEVFTGKPSYDNTLREEGAPRLVTNEISPSKTKYITIKTLSYWLTLKWRDYHNGLLPW